MSKSPYALRLPADLKLLIVEDEAIITFDVEALLRESGASIIFTAEGLAQTRELLRKHPDIGVVLLDILLRDGNALEIIPELDQLKIPYIFTTGYQGAMVAEIPIVWKPYPPEKLIAAILAVLERRGTTQKR
jgi:CheY-like chemotaxis protein